MTVSDDYPASGAKVFAALVSDAHDLADTIDSACESYGSHERAVAFILGTLL